MKKLILLITLITALSLAAESAPKRYKGQRKQEQKFRENKLENLSEQDRIFCQHLQKHYSKRRLTAKLRRASWN